MSKPKDVRRSKFTLQGRRDVVRPVLLEVVTEDEWGRPKEVVVRYDEEVLNVKPHEQRGPMRFWILFAPDQMFQPKTRGDA